MPKLRDSVVVVTGASSGLGRATAVELAKRGASLVLAARRDAPLEDVARDCRNAGGRAIAVITDVSVASDVDALAHEALDAYGRIDVWINNAAITLFSPLEEGPFEDHQRVIETNLFGAMHGARAAIPIFRRQHRGLLINVGSVLGEVGHAFVPSYVISKFGIHGLSEALRVEVADEPDIQVSTVFPFVIDTPHFEVAANRIARVPRALPPMQSPERVARVIAAVCERPRRVRFVPRWITLGLALHAIAPQATERVLLDALRKFHVRDREQVTAGNLYTPAAGPARVHGKRPPRISTTRFVLWVAAHFVRVELALAAQRVRGWIVPRPRRLQMS